MRIGVKHRRSFSVPAHKEKPPTFYDSGKSHKFDAREECLGQPNQLITAAWASAIPTPKKIALPMATPMILSPMLLMYVSPAPNFDNWKINGGQRPGCASARRALETSQNNNINSSTRT